MMAKTLAHFYQSTSNRAPACPHLIDIMLYESH
jgi:hypothetical protein